MRILVIAYLPFLHPISSPVDYVLLNHLRIFSRDHEMVLLCAVHDASEEDMVRGLLGQYCHKIYTVVTTLPNPDFSWNKFGLMLWLRIIMNTARFYSHRRDWSQIWYLPMYSFYSDKFSRLLKQVIRLEAPRVIHFHDILSSAHVQDTPSVIPTVFYLQDSLSRYYFFQNESSFLYRLYNHSRYISARHWEKFIIPRCDRTILLNEEDKQWILTFDSTLRLDIVDFGIDAEFFSPQPFQEEYPSVAFSGLMSIKPNIDAALFFSREVLASVRREIDNVKFFIIGVNPPACIRGLVRDPLTTVTGYVPDLREYIMRCTIFIAPVRIGSGLKSKILLPMSMGKAVIATSKAIEGMKGMTDGRNILLADTPEEFIRKTILLLKDRALRQEIGHNARKTILAHYSWDGWKMYFSQLYSEILENP